MRLAVATALCLLLAACPGPDAPGTPPPADAAQAGSLAPDATPAPAAADDSPAPLGEGDGDATADPAAPDHARLLGRVSYPSEELPAMRVCAIAATDPGLGHCRLTAVNQPHYELAVPAGDWWLVAWPQDTGTAGDPGLLSAASECLGSVGVGCDDHALLAITVAAGEVREGLDINDWYYDPQATPPPMPPRGETGE